MFSTGTGSYTLTVRPSGGDTVQEFTYDRFGNRTNLTETKNGTVTVTAYAYDQNDRLISEKTGSQAQITYSYDDNGNMTGKTDGTVQTFDALNRMTRYQKGSSYVTYTYYPDDMRKSKKAGTATATEHVWLNDEIALDLNGTTVISSYIHGHKLITSDYGWYQYNAHGDVVSLADGSGYVTRNYDYDPFGVQIGCNAGADNNPYRYCGEYYDAESGYTYLRARYYDPAIGRFISEDPAFDGFNWYTYCENDPINNIDPTGMWGYRIHRNMTEFIAKGVGFTAHDAKLIAYGDWMADTSVVQWGGWLNTKLGIKLSKGINWKKIGFGNSLRADGKIRAHRAFENKKQRITGRAFAVKRFGSGLNTAVKSFSKGSKEPYIRKLLALGLRLHAQQDHFAHGPKGSGRPHTKYSDDIWYDYTGGKDNSGYVVVNKLKNNKRLENTVKATYVYLNRAYKKLKGVKGAKLGTRTVKNKAGAWEQVYKKSW